MIVEEFKRDSTLIRIDDKYIESDQKSKEIVDILISLIIKKLKE